MRTTLRASSRAGVPGAALAQPPLLRELLRFDPSTPIQQAVAPPASWYTRGDFMSLERSAVFGKGWHAVDVVRCLKPGDYQAGTVFGRPYLITCAADPAAGRDRLQAFWNVCPHMGSCVAVPRDEGTGRPLLDSRGVEAPGSASGIHCSNGDRAIAGNGMRAAGETARDGGRVFTCPYHGWRFNQDGRLIASVAMKGIKDFKPREHGLKPVGIHVDGPVIYLNFSEGFVPPARSRGREAAAGGEPPASPDFAPFHAALEENGFHPTFGDVEWVHTREYKINCNWKVFLDNYGDGCYHCKVAHPALVANIDESAYSTEVLSGEISVQRAPPAEAASARFGSREALYAMVYPNIMYNRYGRWLDTNIVKPISETESIVQIDWFLDRSVEGETEEQRRDFVRESIASSEEVQSEDVFLCENVQTGMNSGGFDRGRYIPGKQLAGYHFHLRLARDLREGLGQGL